MTVPFAVSQVTYAQRRFSMARAAGELPSRRAYHYPRAITFVIFVACLLQMIFLLVSGAISHPILFPIFLVFSGVLGGLIVRLILDWKRYDLAMRSAYLPGSLDGTLLHSRMELASDGLWIWRGDMYFFSPWKDVACAQIDEALLVIKFSNGTENLVPRFSAGCEVLNLEEIRSEIDRLRKDGGENARPDASVAVTPD